MSVFFPASSHSLFIECWTSIYSSQMWSSFEADPFSLCCLHPASFSMLMKKILSSCHYYGVISSLIVFKVLFTFNLKILTNLNCVFQRRVDCYVYLYRSFKIIFFFVCVLHKYLQFQWISAQNDLVSSFNKLKWGGSLTLKYWIDKISFIAKLLIFGLKFIHV